MLGPVKGGIMTDTQVPNAPVEMGLLARLRDAREELTATTRLIDAGNAATDADRSRCEADLRAVVTAERAGIDHRLAAAAAVLEEQPELAADYSDSLTRITNDWAAF